MRIARTIQDVSELLADYQVSVLLTDENTIEFEFPDTEEEVKYREIGNWRVENFSHIPESDPIHFSRKTRYVVRGLVESPRFWRLTTVADQLGRFALGYKNREETRYGTIKVRKKANENLKILFENMRFAKRFIKDLERTKLLIHTEV